LDLSSIGVALPVDDGLTAPDLLRLAVLAEREGYGTVVAGEVSGTEAFSLLGAVAGATSTVTLGTAVVGVGVRSLALTIMGFSTLAALAPHRIVAGLGVSSRTIIEDWHGRQYGPPLEQLRQFIPSFRRGLAGERLDVEEATLRCRGFKVADGSRPRIPIVIGALNPRMVELAGCVADGVILAWASDEELARRAREFRQAAADADRDAASLAVMATIFVHAGAQPDRAMSLMRRRMIGYSLSSGHRAAFDRLIPRLDEVRDLWITGERAKAEALIPEGAVANFAVIGTPADVVERLSRLAAMGIDVPIIYPIAEQPGADVGSTISAVADQARGG
jgi:probable F420-dependent oxidoreductase